MMMPANFSVVAENEMTYVVGGASIFADGLTMDNWAKFNKNMVTIIGNSFLNGFVSATVGSMFNGSYYPGKNTVTYFGKLKNLGVLNGALNIAGNAAAVYNLATGTSANYVAEDEVYKVWDDDQNKWVDATGAWVVLTPTHA